MGMPPERIFYGYDVVDNSYFQRAVHAARANARTRQDRGLPERPYFLALGRFVPKKNFLGLLRAYEIYRSTTDPQSAWSLAIAGDGPQREEIQRAIAHSQFSKSIVVLPFQQYHDLPTVYAHASCFVIASIENEQWGLVVNEAMACGLPVLASGQCGCASSLIRDGENGFLLDPADEPGMAHTMARFAALSDHARAAMERRSEEIIADWSLERFAQSFIAAANLATSRPRTRRWRDRLFAHALSAAKR
jgi:glycosyltransferase involved in cell wall biosynthesis